MFDAGFCFPQLPQKVGGVVVCCGVVACCVDVVVVACRPRPLMKSTPNTTTKATRATITMRLNRGPGDETGGVVVVV